MRGEWERHAEYECGRAGQAHSLSGNSGDTDSLLS